MRLLRILACQRRAHGHRVVSMQENSAVSGSFTKGLSPSPALNHLARQRMASSVAAEIPMLVPWVQTTHQAADDVSRDVALQLQLQGSRSQTA